MNKKRMLCLIFDIDGVLIEDTRSYYEAIKQTFSFMISHLFQKNVSPETITDDMIKMFKKLGGFNDDYDVTAAFLYYYVSLLDLSGKQKSSWNFDAFLARCREGGLKGVLDATAAKNASMIDFSQKVLPTKNLILADPVRRIFQEIYLGKELFKEVYDEEVSHCFMEGLIHLEKPLISHSLLKNMRSMCDGLCVATGRGRDEALYTLKEHFSSISFDHIVTATDLSFSQRKPDPESLLKIDLYFKERGETERSYIFVGDQIDDISMALSAKKSMDIDSVAFCREGGTLSAKDLKTTSVDHIVRDHSELESIVKKRKVNCG